MFASITSPVLVLPVSCSCDIHDFHGDANRDKTSAEDARVQENPASDDLPHIVDHSSQFRHLDGYVADLLLRVRRSPLGHRPAGSSMYGMRCQVPREVQGSTERRLLAE